MINCKSFKFSSLYKKGWLIMLFGLIFMPAISFAQADEGCDGTDPTNPCPLDSYVWLLAILALIFGAVYLHRQQKEQSRV